MALLSIKNILFLIVGCRVVCYNDHGCKTVIPEYTSCEEGALGSFLFYTVLMTV